MLKNANYKSDTIIVQAMSNVQKYEKQTDTIIISISKNPRENLWLAITTEDPDEAVQSSDPFASIIHPARGDRDAGLLFS